MSGSLCLECCKRDAEYAPGLCSKCINKMLIPKEKKKKPKKIINEGVYEAEEKDGELRITKMFNLGKAICPFDIEPLQMYYFPVEDEEEYFILAGPRLYGNIVNTKFKSGLVFTSDSPFTIFINKKLGVSNHPLPACPGENNKYSFATNYLAGEISILASRRNQTINVKYEENIWEVKDSETNR